MKTAQSLLTLIYTGTVLLSFSESGWGIEPPVSPSALAEKLGLARDSFTVEDLTEEARARRDGGPILSAHRFESADKTAPVLTVFVARPGLLWTEKYQAQIQKALEQARADGNTNVPIQRFRFGDQGEGVYRLSGFGALAVEFEITATFPTQAREVRLKALMLNDPDDKNVSDVPDLRADEWLRRGIVLVGEAITGAPVEITWSNEPTGLKPATPAQPTTNTAKPSAPPTVSDSAPAAPLAQPYTGKSWLLLAGLAALGAVAWILLKGRGQ